MFFISILFFDAITNGIAFLISLSEILLLMCSNTTDFCMFILYPSTYLNSLIGFNSLLVKSLGFSLYKIMSCANRQFYFFLSNSNSFISFSCLIAWSRTSNNLLSRSGKSKHPYRVPGLSGKAFSFSLLSTMVAVGLSRMASVMSRYTPSVPSRDVSPFGISGPHWKKSRLEPHSKCVATCNYKKKVS